MSLRWNKYIARIGTEIAIESCGNPPALLQKRDLSSAQGNVERCTHFDTLIAVLPRSQLALLDVIEVTVGYPYVNHMVLPWQDEIISPADRLAYAESMLEQHYGIVRADWYCEISQEKFGFPAIASAIRRDIVDDILMVCQSRKLRVQRVQTLLSDTINRHSGVLHSDAVFVVHQSDGCEFAFRQDGKWCSAFSVTGQGKHPEECLMSASIMANIFPTNVYLSDLSGEAGLALVTNTVCHPQLPCTQVVISQENTHDHL